MGVGGPRTRRAAGGGGRHDGDRRQNADHEVAQIDRDFKLRENLAIGCKVTLRRESDVRIPRSPVSVALPRVRDFRASAPQFRRRATTPRSQGADRVSGDRLRQDGFGARMDIVICTTAKDPTPKPRPC